MYLWFRGVVRVLLKQDGPILNTQTTLDYLDHPGNPLSAIVRR